MARTLVVKVTCGTDDAERCNQGFTVAATAAASGVPVSVWLTGEAAWFALPGRAAELDVPLATPLPELLRSARVAQEQTYNPTPLMAAAAIYFVLLWPFARWVAVLERRAMMRG